VNLQKRHDFGRAMLFERTKVMSRKSAPSDRDAFIKRLKVVITEYQAIAERLLAGTDHVFSTGRHGGEEISIETARHYKRLISHYRGVVTRYEAEKKGKKLGQNPAVGLKSL
jgi:hypothetical protein